MKKIVIFCASLFMISAQAQFKIHFQSPENFAAQEAYIYTLNGSKDILLTKINKVNNSWDYKTTKPYVGMMKIFFPGDNNSINFISENKDINIQFETNAGKITNINYLDQANKIMDDLQDFQRKKEQILPALIQIKDYYKSGSDFGLALKKEIDLLSKNAPVIDATKNPLVSFYSINSNKFISNNPNQTKPSREEILSFLTKSDYLLETSSLLRPILVEYLNAGGKSAVEPAIDTLLTTVNTETPRGQVVLSELIELFDAYEMKGLKDKYLSYAQNLKCTINERLASTIAVNKNLELNSKFPNYTFNNPTKTKAKSIYDVKSDKKVVIFWSSTCSHCEQEIPQFLSVYDKLKANNIEIIGMSLDNNKDEYQNKVNSLPWINDTELRGWYSSFNETYNIHATPTYFILDSQNKIIAKPNHVGDVLEYLKVK